MGQHVANKHTGDDPKMAELKKRLALPWAQLIFRNSIMFSAPGFQQFTAIFLKNSACMAIKNIKMHVKGFYFNQKMQLSNLKLWPDIAS